MFREDVRREMTRAWLREFSTLRKEVVFQREGNFDPVLETKSLLLDETVKGIFRKIEQELQDGVNITNKDSKFTILQQELVNSVDQTLVIPKENDIILYNNDKWRVLAVKEDSANIFWNLIIRGV